MFTKPDLAKLKHIDTQRVCDVYDDLRSNGEARSDSLYRVLFYGTTSNQIETVLIASIFCDQDDDDFDERNYYASFINSRGDLSYVPVNMYDPVLIYRDESNSMNSEVPVALTQQEREALSYLVKAWDEFLKLPMQHPAHAHEFSQAIHAAQRIIMSRPVARAEGWTKDTGAAVSNSMPE